MFGGITPVTSNRLPGVLNINFNSLGDNAARNVAVKLVEFGYANSTFDVLDAFLKVEPSKRSDLRSPHCLSKSTTVSSGNSTGTKTDTWIGFSPRRQSGL